MKKKLKLFMVFSFFSLTMSVSGAEINEFFSDQEKKILNDGQIITKVFLKGKGTLNTLNTDNSIILPALTILNLVKDYEMICVEKAFFPYSLNSKSGLSFYNMLASPSKLSGMKYYSVTDKKIQPFITKSSRIDTPSNKNEIKDTVFTSIRPEYTQFFKITDNRFGEIVFRSKLYNNGNTFILNNTSVQPMKKYMVTINNKEEYRLISFFIYDAVAGGFFYYSVQAMRIRTNYFLKLGILNKESFANRIRAGTVHMAGLLGLDWNDKLITSLIQ